MLKKKPVSVLLATAMVLRIGMVGVMTTHMRR